MKVCIIGNSHAGSLLRAINLLPRDMDPCWDFFVVPNGYSGGIGLGAVTYNEEEEAFVGFPYVRCESGTNCKIRMYDAIVLIGAHLSAAHIARKLVAPMSPAFRRAAAEDHCLKSRFYPMVKQIRVLSEKQIYLITKPAPSNLEKFLEADVEGARNAMQNFWSRLGVKIIPQISSTIDANGLTIESCFRSATDRHLRDEISMKMVEVLRDTLNPGSRAHGTAL